MSARVALIVDNPLRDLPGMVLVGCHLAARGQTVLLVPHNGSLAELQALAPDFVLLNYLRVNNEKLARLLAEANIGFGVLDTEGGVLAGLESYDSTLSSDRELFKQVGCYCAWGPRTAEHLVARGLLTEKQATVTGSARCDYFVEPWRQAAWRNTVYAEAYPPPLVLVNGNFPYANPRFQSPEKERRMMVDHFGWSEKVARDLQNKVRKAMHALAGLTNDLAARFPDISFIYRPHPFEKTETYHDLLVDRPNLHMIKKGTSDGWILRACCVIQRSCSTAVDAALSGVPALSPAWIPPAVTIPTADVVSLQLPDPEAMFDAVSQAAAGEAPLPPGLGQRLDDVVADWFYRVDGQSALRVAKAILGCLEEQQQAAGSGRALQKTLSPASMRRQMGDRLRRLLRLPADFSFRRMRRVRPEMAWYRSEKAFLPEQVEQMVGHVLQAAAGTEHAMCEIRVRPARQALDPGPEVMAIRSVILDGAPGCQGRPDLL
jgi:surface carbohydrate biosynthesis protein